MKLKEATVALASLAQPARLKVFRILVKSSGEGMGAGEISVRLGIPKPTLSFHLRDLTLAGLIEREREGRRIRYRVREKGMRQLMTFLTEDCCQGRPELCLPPAKEGRACCAE